MRPLLLVALIALPCSPAQGDSSAVIVNAPLDSSRPYYVPTHPRVTTTVRFPGAIGAPDGSVAVFTEDANRQTAEYLVTWQAGDAYFTLAPLRESSLANLNIPYDGRTYVVYFYSVPNPFEAVALVNLAEPGAPGAPPAGSASPGSAAEPVQRTKTLPPPGYAVATPARLVGFLDRLKLVHATPPGPALAGLVKAMNLQVAVSREELGGKAAIPGPGTGLAGEIATGLNDAGLYQIILLRAVRDSRLNCIGFVCLVRNVSETVLTFDVKSFGARAGAEYLGQRISDATPVLNPGEQATAYFAVQPPPGRPLSAANEWKITVELASPRLNPGAAVARRLPGAGDER